MGLPDLIKSLIAGPITSIAGPFRTPVVWTPMTEQGTYGPVYGVPEDQEAVVEISNEAVASLDGTIHVAAAKFLFFDRIAIKEGDLLKIGEDGVDATVVKVGGVLAPDGLPYAPEAWTGKQ